jgi:thiol-disulfide isomerase/thioredoxin
MRRACFSLLFSLFLLLSAVASLCASDLPADKPKPGEPTDAKARKSWDSALSWERKGYEEIAIDELREANREDGGHCSECLRRAYAMATLIGSYKDAVDVARDALAAAGSDTERATAQARLGEALRMQSIVYKKKAFLQESAEHYKAALALNAHQPAIHFGYGLTLAQLHTDEAARAEFKAFLDGDRDQPYLRLRAERFVERIDLARIPLAPDFHMTTMDGKQWSRDSLAGKVVLIDFWATWCKPCREALPQIEKLAAEFGNSPFVLISVNLDNDRDDWTSFVRRNNMTWPQYSDAPEQPRTRTEDDDGRTRGFAGPMARLFGVNAIPATFSIDADGILKDERVGETDIEGKLKKMIAQAAEAQKRKDAAVPAAATTPTVAK